MTDMPIACRGKTGLSLFLLYAIRYQLSAISSSILGHGGRLARLSFPKSLTVPLISPYGRATRRKSAVKCGYV